MYAASLLCTLRSVDRGVGAGKLIGWVVGVFASGSALRRAGCESRRRDVKLPVLEDLVLWMEGHMCRPRCALKRGVRSATPMNGLHLRWGCIVWASNNLLQLHH